jgi:thioredoxin-disulfide reductase
MIFNLVIIGGGPAALTAGIYATRKKLKTLILAKQVGGQTLLAENIENFPGFEKISGKELIEKMRMQNEKYGVEIKEGIEIVTIKKENKDFLIELKNGEKIETKSIIIATGKNPRRLNIPGEKEFAGRGVSFCSTCDAPLFDKKEVAVIGGGNSGLAAALDLANYATKIYILDSLPKMAGDELLIEKLKQDKKVKFIVNAEVKEIKGDKFVESIVYNNKELPVGGIFINIGWIPATEFLKGFVNLNEEGEIIVDSKTNETSIKGVFGAGDVTDVKYKQCVIAAAEGAKAALSAYNYLTSN